MTKPGPPPLKHAAIAAALEREIRSGGLARGQQLPGEKALAERFAVSRSTVRQALAELGRAGLIATHSGRGSFVTYEGAGAHALSLPLTPRHTDAATMRARALGALTGLAVGDALGMPTQMMSRAQVAARFGALVGFEPAAPDHPLAAGMPAGSITDDTEQALIVARALVAGHGRIHPAALAAQLVAWEDDMRARGSLDLLGPSTRSAVSAVLDGVPIERAGRFGVTNGAAMRVAPVGIAHSAVDLGALVDRVEEASMATHNTGIAIGGASAVAAAVSAGVEGATVREALAVGVAAAAIGVERGFWVAGADVSRRIAWAVGLVDGAAEATALDDVSQLVGTSLATQESVPAAFALLAVHSDDPWRACLAAASLGGDSDTVAAMVGAIAGACHGAGAFPSTAVETVRRVNDLDLAPLADALVALR